MVAATSFRRHRIRVRLDALPACDAVYLQIEIAGPLAPPQRLEYMVEAGDPDHAVQTGFRLAREFIAGQPHAERALTGSFSCAPPWPRACHRQRRHPAA